MVKGSGQERRCVACGSTQLTTRFALASYEAMACLDCGMLFKSSLWTTDATALEAVYQSPDYWTSYANRQDGGVDYDVNHPRVRLYRRDVAVIEQLMGGRGRLLDVGCARGVFLDVARRAGWTVSGIELSSFAARYARDQFGLDVFEGRLEQAPWPESSFDAITMFDVIEHLQDPNAILSSARRLLRPGGCLLLTTPNADSLLHRLSLILYRLSLNRVQKPALMIYGYGPDGHVLFFRHATLTKLLARHGFCEARFSLDAVDQGLWAPLTSLVTHRFLSLFDRCVAGPLRAKYRMVLCARRTEEAAGT